MFVTFFMARSGSKYLRSLLNQHPDINDFGEVFHDRTKNFDSSDGLLRKFAEIALADEPVAGFQFRYPRHVKEFPEIFNLIESNKNIKMILLKRRNKLKGAISQQNSEKLKSATGKAHLFKGSAAKIDRLELDVGRVVRESLQREDLDRQYRLWAEERFEVMDVFYEDLCIDPEFEVNRVCEFLGCSPFKSSTLRESDLVKVTSDRISEAVSNFEELVAALGAVDRLEWLDGELVNKHVASEKKNIRAEKVPRVADKGEIIAYEGKGFSGKRIKLKVESLYVKTNCRFLEWSHKRELVASQGETLRISSDHAKSWGEIVTPCVFKKCYTTLGGVRLLQADDGVVYRYDEKGRFIDSVETGAHPWHGTWSIDQNPDTGTIIWCEYPYSDSEVNVWRSQDEGRSWSKCFVQKGHASDPKLGDIRHFHLVQKCSSIRGRWYLSSGDTELQSKFWVSDDDGESWKLVPINEVDGDLEGVPEELYGRLHRFTSIIQTDDKIIWVTDDTFKGAGARMCVVDKNKLSVVRVVSGGCGKNEIRNLIKIDDKFALAVSESKVDVRTASLVLIDFVNERLEWIGVLDNERGVKANFMNGLSAKSAFDGVFYSSSDNKVVYPAAMTLRWGVEISND